MNFKQLVEDSKLTKRVILVVTYTVLLIFALFHLDKLFGFILSIFRLHPHFLLVLQLPLWSMLF